MTGFGATTRSVASLEPGDRVAWHETYRVVQSVQPIGDGTDHLSVTYQDGSASRYSAMANVTVLEVGPMDEGGAA